MNRRRAASTWRPPSRGARVVAIAAYRRDAAALERDDANASEANRAEARLLAAVRTLAAADEHELVGSLIDGRAAAYVTFAELAIVAAAGDVEKLHAATLVLSMIVDPDVVDELWRMPAMDGTFAASYLVHHPDIVLEYFSGDARTILDDLGAGCEQLNACAAEWEYRIHHAPEFYEFQEILRQKINARSHHQRRVESVWRAVDEPRDVAGTASIRAAIRRFLEDAGAG